MIKIDPKPHKTIQFFNGSILLDQEYSFVISKQINGEVKHTVVSITPDSPSHDLISQTIINYCDREGVGNPENK